MVFLFLLFCDFAEVDVRIFVVEVGFFAYGEGAGDVFYRGIFWFRAGFDGVVDLVWGDFYGAFAFRTDAGCVDEVDEGIL